jgi:hypothetical protein
MRGKLLGSSLPVIRATHLNTYKPLKVIQLFVLLMVVWATINGTGECGLTGTYSNRLYLVVLVRGGGCFTVQGYRLFVSERL